MSDLLGSCIVSVVVQRLCNTKHCVIPNVKGKVLLIFKLKWHLNPDQYTKNCMRSPPEGTVAQTHTPPPKS